MFRLKQKYFNLSYTSDEAAIMNYFAAEIQYVQEINIELRGFLTIGKVYKGFPIWNTRWCCLRGFNLRYWNYPNEEYVSEPLGDLDLRKCIKFETRQEPSICPKRNKLYLQFNNNPSGVFVTEYYLFADSVVEFDHWENNLSLVYNVLERDGFLF